MYNIDNLSNGAENLYMHNSKILLGALALLLPASGIAALSDYATNEHEMDCIQSIGITEQQLATGFFKYQIDRCAEERIDRIGHREELTRLQRRQQRLLDTYSRLTRNSRRLNLSGHINAVIRVRGGEVYEDVDASVSPIAPTRSVSRPVQNTSSVNTDGVRASRAREAREVCRDAQKSFYQNCVRDELRQPGLGVSRYIKISTIQQRRSAEGGRTLSPKERRKVSADLRIERAKKARNICRNVDKSYYKNCVRNQMRLLGQ